MKSILCTVALVTLISGVAPVRAEQIKVLRPQGTAHGFVEVTTLDGTRIAVGDLQQRLRGEVVTSTLTLNFSDGSLDEETTVYSQHGVFRFIRDHHVQHGPSYPEALDVSIEAATGTVTSTDPSGRRTTAHVEMPPDVYNGLASSVLMNAPPGKAETRVAIVVASAKPRIVHLLMKKVGEASFTIGGAPRKATDYGVHVELGGVAGVVAPLIGKQPLDYHVLILSGSDPAFIREEGPLYIGGPVWRIQQVSAVFPAK